MSWKYYKDGKLRAECNDIPETMEDAILELQENGIDISDCVVDNGAYQKPCDETDVCNEYAHTGCCNCDDFWSPDYPPEENDLMFQPLSDEEMKQYKECIAILKPIQMKASDDFMDKLHKRIDIETRVSRYQRFINWCQKWTDEEVSHLLFWIITIYVMIGVIKYEPKMIEIILWPFI